MRKVAITTTLIVVAIIAFFAYNIGHTNGRTDMVLEMRDLFKGCKFEE